MSLPTDSKERKRTPITTGVLDYFPDALAEVARVSVVGNEQHNPGEPLHWAREKSTDQADCIVRHLIERGKLDSDGMRHTAKVAWRALALLQTELDDEAKAAAVLAPKKLGGVIPHQCGPDCAFPDFQHLTEAEAAELIAKGGVDR